MCTVYKIYHTYIYAVEWIGTEMETDRERVRERESDTGSRENKRKMQAMPAEIATATTK